MSSRRVRTNVTRLFLLAVFGTLSRAAQNDPAYKLSVQARIASITTLVRDKSGHPVSGLTRDDFSLWEDGARQTIRYVDSDSNLPLRMGLLIDTSSSESGHYAEERRASAAFLQAMLARPGDQALLVQFDWNILLLQSLTSNVTRLQSALDDLEKPHPPRSGPGGGTLLFDALCASTQRMAGPDDQRRALVVLTDGEDHGSNLDYESVIRVAQYTNTVIYTIFYSSHDPGPTVGIKPEQPSTGRDVMERISDRTGGRLFVPSRVQPLATIFSIIEADLRSRYRVGYTPPASKPMTYHSVQLRTRDKKATVQAQSGYFTPKH